jgi:hypothetical protein
MRADRSFPLVAGLGLHVGRPVTVCADLSLLRDVASLVALATAPIGGTPFSLAPGAIISGHVYESDGVTPITTGIVTLIDSTGRPIASGGTDPLGNYSIVTGLVGSFTLHAYAISGANSTPTPVTIAGGVNQIVNFTAGIGALRVAFDAGASTVVVFSATPGLPRVAVAIIENATTGVLIGNLAAGAYTVEVQAPNAFTGSLAVNVNLLGETPATVPRCIP